MLSVGARKWIHTHRISGVSSFFYLKNCIFLSFPLLIVLGNFQIWIGSSSITLPFAIIFLLPIFIFDIINWRRIVFIKKTLPFFIMYLLIISAGLFSSSLSTDVPLSRNLASMLPMIMAFFVLFCFRNVAINENFSRFFLCAGALLAALVIGKVLFFVIVESFFKKFTFPSKSEIGLPLGMSNYLAVYLVFFSVFAFRASKPLWFILLAATLVTSSRFGVIFFIWGSLAAWTLHYFKSPVVCFFTILLPLLGFLFVMVFHQSVLYTINDVDSLSSFASRIKLWASAVDALNSAPFVGLSPGGYTSWLEALSWPEAVWGPHNFLLSIWLDYGFVGLAVYLIILFAVIFKSARKGVEQSEITGLALIVVIAYGLVENVSGTISFEMLISYIICLIFQSDDNCISKENFRQKNNQMLG